MIIVFIEAFANHKLLQYATGRLYFFFMGFFQYIPVLNVFILMIYFVIIFSVMIFLLIEIMSQDGFSLVQTGLVP